MTSPVSAVEAKAKALEQFTDYFVRNYPGPDTTIYDPKWHAPKIFAAAYSAITAALSNQERAAEVDVVKKIDGVIRKLHSLHHAFDMQGANSTTMLRAVNTLSTIRASLVDVPVEAVAWLDDGTCRAGTDRTAHRVVTDDQKRDMPQAIALSFTIPLYASPLYLLREKGIAASAIISSGNADG